MENLIFIFSVLGFMYMSFLNYKRDYYENK